MERLHAYWRMPYIEDPKPRDDSGKKGGNPFVEMAKSDDFQKFHILWKGKYSFIVMNKFPYNCGHLLVLPLREVGDIEALEGEEKLEFFSWRDLLCAKRARIFFIECLRINTSIFH